MKRTKTAFALCMFCMLCFMFTGCLAATSDEGEGYAKLVDDLNDLRIASMGNGEETGQYAYDMVTHLTDLIYAGLVSEYGANATIERSSSDTHKNAKTQDGWLWQFDEVLEASEVKNYLQYNLSCVLAGKPVLTFTPTQFSSPEYLAYKNAGTFDRGDNGGLRELVNKFYHTGYYFYELDNLAEYILKNVIGEEVVAIDNFKFYDVNENTTFDYVENYGSSATYNIITSYELEYASERDEEVARNGVWVRIEFGTNTAAPIVVSDTEIEGKDPKDIIVASQVTSERAYTLTEIESLLSAYITNHSLNSTQSEELQSKFKQRQNTAVYSGFKNYVNTIYYILYSSMKNFTFTSEGELIVIPDVLTMTHKPNIVQDVISIIDSEYDTEHQKFNIPCKEYKSVLVTAKKLLAINTFMIAVYTDMQEELQVDIKLRYHFTDDSYREYIGPYSGESKTVEGLIMTLVVPPNDGVAGAINLTITPETYPGLIDRGYKFTENDITPLARAGVNNIVLGKYNPYTIINPTYVAKWWQFIEGYMSMPNTSHLGSSFAYKYEDADFLEILFDVRGEYTEQISFGFGFLWM